MALFQYTYTDGTTVTSDSIVNADHIFELIFLRDTARFAKDKIRPHQSHPIHEATMKTLPPNLNILRAIGTRCRTWPLLPPSIHECYLSNNMFLYLPDLSAYANLIVLELDDNCIATVDQALPPTLTRLNLNSNALRSFNKALIPTSCASVTTFMNPVDFFPRAIAHLGVRRQGGGVGGATEEPKSKKCIY